MTFEYCKYCKKRFSRKTSLYRHLKDKHTKKAISKHMRNKARKLVASWKHIKKL